VDLAPVVVYWTDSRSDDGCPSWKHFNDVKSLKPCTVITRGWLIDQDEDCIRVCRDWIEGEMHGSDFIAISLKDIIRVEKRHQTTRM